MYRTEKCSPPPETQTRVPTRKLSTGPLYLLLSPFLHICSSPNWHLPTFGSSPTHSIVSLTRSQHALSLYPIMSPVPQGRDPQPVCCPSRWPPGTGGAVSHLGLMLSQDSPEELRARARVFMPLCVGEGELLATSLNTGHLRSAFQAAQKIIASPHQHSLLLAHHSPSEGMPIKRKKQETELVVTCYSKSAPIYSLL